MLRRWLILVVALAALCGSLAAWSATTAERDFHLRGWVDPTVDSRLPYRLPRLGVNADLRLYNDPAAELARMAQGGVHWVRQRASWGEIEPQPGVYDWTAWDRIAEAFAAHPDIEWVAVLVESPSWSRSSDTPTAPPDDPAQFAAFAAAFAARYGAMVDFYQVWDEPNLADAWGLREPRPADYLALLSAAYTAIKAGDSSAAVIAAALAPTTEDNSRNISDLVFLRDLYALGAADVMDAAAAKPYGFSLPPDDRTVDPAVLNFSRLIALREIMLEYNDGHSALWASEWGWNALPPEWDGSPSIWGQVSADQRVAYTLSALDRAEREWAWLGGMILESWQPNAQTDDPRWGFALIDAQNASTPLWEALIARPQQTTASNGLYFPTTSFARYSGVWTFGQLGADIGWINDSRLAFDFTGTDAALLLRRDNYLAFLYPTIDGHPPNALPRDPNGNAFITLRSADQTPRLDLIPVARDLPPGARTLDVVADRGWDRWALAGFAVSSGDLAAPYDRQIAVAAITAAVSLLAAAAAALQIDWRAVGRLRVLWDRLNDAAQFSISVMTSLALMIGLLLTWRSETPSIFTREPIQLGLALLTAGIIYLQPHIVVVIAALLALFWIVYNRPDFGLMLTLLFAPFFLFPVELYRFAFPMAELVLLLTVGALLLRGLAWWGRWRQSVTRFVPRLRLTALDLGVIAWVAVGALSLAWTEQRAPAITELRTLLIEPALFYVVLRLLPRDDRTDRRLIDALIAAGVLMALVGLLMYARGEGIITAEGGSERLAGVYGSPNNVGLFVGRCVPFALAFALLGVDRRRRIAAALALLPLTAALLLSQSAGALFIGVPAGIAAVLLLTYGRRALLPLAAIVGVVGVGMAVALQSARFERLLDFAQGTTFFRIRVWASAWQAVIERPLTGLGLDQFLYAFQGRFMMPDAWQEPNLSHPHNIILDVWTRLGLLGLIVLLWLQTAFWRVMIRAYRAARPTPHRFALVVGSMGCMINILAHGLVDNSLFVVDLALIFMLLIGMASRTLKNGA
jgi:hypothetical protein